MNRQIASMIVVVLTCGAAKSHAQWFANGWGGGPAFSSTVYEGACRGEADYVRSYGWYLESEARAAYMWQMVDNAQAEYRYRIYATRRETDELDRLAKAARRAAAEKAAAEQPIVQAPQGMPLTELSSTGKINWPIEFRDQRFSQQTQRLDQLFATRAQGTYRTVDRALTRQIVDAIESLKQVLKGQIREMRGEEYLEAKRFVDRLAREAEVPAAPRVLAAN